MIHVIATIELHEHQRDAFLGEFHKIIPEVLNESGCLAYAPAVDANTDIDRQTRKGNNCVTIIEQWESVEALKAHLVAPHMLSYRERVKDFIAKATLHILEPA